MASSHTKNNLARFNPAIKLPPPDRFESLSLADDPTVAMLEVGAILGKLVPGGHLPHPRITVVSLNVHVTLSSVVDMTDVAGCQALLDVTPQELTGDWEGYDSRSPLTPVQTPGGIAPTQELGRSLFNEGIDGFFSISARLGHHKTLTIFPENLRKNGSRATFSDGSTIVHVIP